jgi:hypothetical protein
MPNVTRVIDINKNAPPLPSAQGMWMEWTFYNICVAAPGFLPMHTTTTHALLQWDHFDNAPHQKKSKALFVNINPPSPAALA